MSDYIDLLIRSEERKGSMLCFGMDPVIERMPIDGSKPLSDEITGYFGRILDAVADRISAVKPNVAFYLQYGGHGLTALRVLVREAKRHKLPVIIDAKCGDIGRTSAAYAGFVFETLGGDAVTLNPLMGDDSLEPFFAYPDRGFYVLALTSNPGADMIQRARLEDGKTVSDRLLELICGWNKTVRSAGAVIGATQNEFGRLIRRIKDTGLQIPLLVPGVGAQGGSYGRIEEILCACSYDRGVVRINASSSISYAHEKYPDLSPQEAARKACEEILDG
ncbi:MAG: orotidine-5'-phosphate decarboxylase [Spirochaetes bacterium]|nr:orotidine-5'-phosphate decarboxylase [Spirochaetota bacterium]